MNLYILGITAEEAADIVNVFTFSSDKLEAVGRWWFLFWFGLENIVDFVTELENNQTLIDCFSFSSDQEKAASIIANASPRSCIYGTVTEKRVQFLVDVSLRLRKLYFLIV
mgnify:CR=1 FL=1